MQGAGWHSFPSNKNTYNNFSSPPLYRVINRSGGVYPSYLVIHIYRLHHATLGPERALLKFQNSRRGGYPAIYLPREVIHRSRDLSMTSA